MIKLSCPSCGAEVNLLSKASVFAVCSFCKSTLVRQDMDLLVVGKMADIQDDMSPLQIGTTGTYQGKTFALIGRMRIGYPDGYWNEWYGLQGDKECWLAEAQGFYALCFPNTEIEPPTLDKIKPGKDFEIDGMGTYTVEDVRAVQCVYSEGELPVSAAKGRESTSVDFSAAGLFMATIEYAKNETRVFFGSYQGFDDFKFHKLRTLDGWKL